MNKKSILAFVLVLALIAGCMTAAAYADEAAGSTPDNPVIVDYHEIDASVYEGKWVSTGLGFDVYLPADWVIVEIAKEQADAGLAFLAGEDGGGANMTVTLTPTPEGYSYEQLGQELAAGNTTAAYANLSGLSAVIFDNVDTKVSGFCMLTDGGLISGVVSAPSDDQYEAYAPYIRNMILSVSPTMPSVNWEEVEDAAEKADPDGAFVKLDEVGVKLWVASALSAEELTEEDLKNDYIAYFSDAEQKTALSVFYFSDYTMDDLAAEIKDTKSCTDQELCLINGLRAFTFRDEEYDTLNVALAAGKDCMEFIFWPASDESFALMAAYMSASIQAA